MMRLFTKEEDKFLQDNYLTIPAKQMSRMLNRSENTARQRMKLLGLVVPPEIIQKFKEASWIKKGSVSFNKGKKQSEYMSAAAIKRTKATRFKNGHEPRNIKYDGHERVSKDGYVEMRIKKGKYVLKHRHVWEQKKGVIPKGMVITFKDGNKQNIKISNLKMITLKENMLRNTLHNLPKPLAYILQLRGALNRQINKHTKTINDAEQNKRLA